MYPVSLTLKTTQPAFAVANTAEELSSLMGQGYEPDRPINAAPADVGDVSVPRGGPEVAPGAAPSTVEEARAALEDAGIPYDKRWGLAKLLGALNG